MRIRSVVIAGAIAFATLVALPPAMFGGAILAQTYAPETLRSAVHLATGLGEEGFEAEEIRDEVAMLREAVDLTPIRSAWAEQTQEIAALETQR